MSSKTIEFLNFLLWSAEQLQRPTLRNLGESYEGWAYRKGLLRQARRLEQQDLIERDSKSGDDRLYRLTERGKLKALGGRDPEACWARHWDGKWRLVIFDVPTSQNLKRVRLRRYLRERQFGYLQNSVWITPDPLTEERNILLGGTINVESLVLLDARPCAGESDSEIVAGAWDYTGINRSYERHLRVLELRPKGALTSNSAANALLQWATAERNAWLDAVAKDPLLPSRILPSGYLGQRAWRRRVEVFHAAGLQIRTFNLH